MPCPRRAIPGRPPGLQDHLDIRGRRHARRVSGQLPAGIDSAADLPKITAALLARGYSPEDCHKILGGNLLRVFGEVERVSREMQAAK